MLTYINRVRQIDKEFKSMDAKIDETEVAMAVGAQWPTLQVRSSDYALDALGLYIVNS
jgi:hypothetical protein